MARTILAKELHIEPQGIEHQLAHKVPDALDTLKSGANVLPFHRVA
jgi:hypothetical protein